MWNGLDKLLALQTLDLAIADLEARAQAIPKAIAALEGRSAAARGALDGAKAKADLLGKDRRGKERELDEASQQIKKKQARLFEIKTNEEYSAVLKEIEALKTKMSSLETSILEQMEQGDAAAKLVADAERVFASAQAELQKERQEKEAQLAGILKELGGLREARNAQASRVDPEQFRQYTRLMKTREVAVVMVVNGTCEGCGMALTPQMYAEVRRNDRMFVCSSCNRILHFRG
jgi:hypothetical protein